MVRRWSAAQFFTRWSHNEGFADPLDRPELVRLALQGMRSAGADRCAELVEKTLHLQVVRKARFDDRRMEALQREFYDLGADLNVKLMRLAAEHREAFLLADRREDEKEAAKQP